MTNTGLKPRKEKDRDDLISEVKNSISKGEIQLKDIFDALNIKDCRRLAKKLKKVEVVTREKGKKAYLTPIPSGANSDVDDIDNDDIEYLNTDGQRSEPFPDSENEISDVLNQGMNLENDSEIRGRDRSVDEYSTDRSIVTKENQHIERRVDPFNDKGKMIGKIEKKGNPQSRAPIEMRGADPIKLYSEVMTQGLNQDPYDEKAKRRKASLLKMGLTKEKLEPKIVKSDDLEMRQKLKLEKERYEIDAWRRTQMVEEPNMVDANNGECSDTWRNWFNERMNQKSNWLVEDATIYSHLPPSQECQPPRGFEPDAADWNIFRKSEVQVPWDFEKYGPMMLTENMAYDGTRLYDPSNGKQWSNIIEFLESEVIRKYQTANPGASLEVFERNDGFFWSTILQQWYDTISVSHQSHNIK